MTENLEAALRKAFTTTLVLGAAIGTISYFGENANGSLYASGVVGGGLITYALAHALKKSNKNEEEQ